MKTKLIFILILLSIKAIGQNGRTFTIEKLSKPGNFVEMKSVKGIYEDLILSSLNINHNIIKVEDFPFNIIAQSKLPDKLVSFGYHSFFNGVYQAYSDHRPLTLSPDAIWLLINQGFAQHVNANSEKLRHHFVDFSGQLSLLVATDKINLDDPNSPWELIFPEFTKQIAEHTGNEFINLLSANFSTTTPIEKVASEITIMEAMKSYFEYVVMRFVCGIPEITLLGTTADWQKILDKTKQLGKYDLEWWTKELEPVLEEFIKASKGKINKNFWKNIFLTHTSGKPLCGPAITTIDGWIVKFFPYDNEGNRNNLLKLTSSKNLPEEIVKVDVKFYDEKTGATTPLELWAGFIGLDQNMNNLALTPKIGWMIRKKDVEQLGLQQKFEAENKTTGEISIKVKEIPEALYSLEEIKSLNIQFIDKVVIPDRLTKIKIGTLFIEGKLDKEGFERIKKMFPDTKVHYWGGILE